MEIWTNVKPFDTLLIKFWPEKNIKALMKCFSNLVEMEMIDALLPNKQIAFTNLDKRREILIELFNKSNICDKYKLCKDVFNHSDDFGCVTIAGIRMRLLNNFHNRLGLLNDISFQMDVVTSSGYIAKKKKYNALIFDDGIDASGIRLEAVQILHGNFYLYSTPLIDQKYSTDKQYINFIIDKIIRQIALIADCLVLFLDQETVNRWNDRNDCFKTILSQCFSYDFKVRLFIISLCQNTDRIALTIYMKMISLKPIVLLYDQFKMAPSGGLISLAERACKIGLKRGFKKYWFRSLKVCNLLR